VKCGCSIGRPGFLVKRTALDGTEFRNVPFLLFWFFDLLWSTVEAAQENSGIAPTIFPKRPYKISAAMIFSAYLCFSLQFRRGFSSKG